MTKWNIEKIREECLKLMGWTVMRQSGSLIAAHPEHSKWLREGEIIVNGTPDPTRSLDDALPLMDRFHMLVEKTKKDPPWRAIGCETRKPQRPGAAADSAPLAVCLCALRCSGRDLKEFEA